jgi:NCAIR mutase (PurE)-related protein
MRDAATEIQLDIQRRQRCGLDEAIFAEGKSVAQLNTILAQAAEENIALLFTRLSAEKCNALASTFKDRLEYCETSRTAIFGAVGAPVGPTQIGIVVAGTSDVNVAREVERTLHFNRVASQLFVDVGVAGLWRLTSRLPEISALPIIVAIAGMDAALPTVLGGLIPSAIIAVPTSVGYGVAAGGGTALNAILASCASGITTVNIDNGYGAACAALRIHRLLNQRSASTKQSSKTYATQ